MRHRRHAGPGPCWAACREQRLQGASTIDGAAAASAGPRRAPVCTGGHEQVPGGSAGPKADGTPRVLPSRDLRTRPCASTLCPSRVPRPLTPAGGARRAALVWREDGPRTSQKQAPPSHGGPAPGAAGRGSKRSQVQASGLLSMPLPGPLPWRCRLFQEVFLGSCQAVVPSLTLLSAHMTPRAHAASVPPERLLAQGLPGQPGTRGPPPGLAWRPP